MRQQLKRLEPVALPGGASILPNNGIVNRFTGLAIPQHRGLALVSDADGGDVGGGDSGFLERSFGGSQLRFSDNPGIVFHPAGLGENLGEFLLRYCLHAARAVKDNGA